MSDTIEFTGIMLKHAPIVKKNDVFANVQIKTTEFGAIRTFIRPFQMAGIEGSLDLFKESSLPWNKLNIPVSDYDLYYNIKFDSVNFDAKLINISVNTKQVKDSSVTDYILSFNKCIEASDSNVSYYIKHKEEDENGKMKLVEYNVKLDQIDGMPGTNL